MNKKSLYNHNQYTVKEMGHLTRITCTSVSRTPGIEIEEERKYTPKCTLNDSKLDNNLCRAKSMVRELGLCNPWDYFVTLTISPEKYDRYNLPLFIQDFAKFLHNYNKRCSFNEKVSYLLIPERHKDGAWHIHGLIKGIRQKDLYTNQYGYLVWKQYQDKFGYISMESIKSKERVSYYILKYFTKDNSKNVTDLGAHLYYRSKGLKIAKVIYRGDARLHADWDYEHPEGFCKIKTIDTRYEDLECILEVL